MTRIGFLYSFANTHLWGGKYGHNCDLSTHENHLRALFRFPRVAVTKHHKLGCLNNTNVLSQSSGGSESKIKVSAGPCSLWNTEGKSFLPLPSFRYLPSILGAPQLVDASLQSHGHFCPRVCTSFSLCPYLLLLLLSHVWLSVTPWAVAHQAPLSMGFPRQEHWSR